MTGSTLAAFAVLSLTVAAAVGAPPIVEKATYTYAVVSGAALKADVYTSTTSRFGRQRPAVVFVHGGGWTCGNRHGFVGWPQWLAANHGVVTIAAEYRLAPVTDAVLGADGRIVHPGTRDGCDEANAPSDDLGLPSRRAPFPAPYEDLRSLMWLLREHADALQIDRHRIAVVGGSAGAHLAGALAVVDSVPPERPAGLGPREIYSRPNAVVSVSGPWNLAVTAERAAPSVPGILRNLFGGEPSAEQRRAASPTTHLPGGLSPVSGRPFPPVLFIHGEADPLVPARQSIEACARMGLACAYGQVQIVPTPPGVDPHDTLYLLQQRSEVFLAFLAATIGVPAAPR